MKTRTILLLVCLLLLVQGLFAAVAADEGQDDPASDPATAKDVGLAIGAEAPDFTLPDIYGGSLTLYEEMGDYQATIVHFFYANGG